MEPAESDKPVAIESSSEEKCVDTTSSDDPVPADNVHEKGDTRVTFSKIGASSNSVF